MVLSKKKSLYERNDKKELVPHEVKLEVDKDSGDYEEYKNETIFVTPITRIELRRLFAAVANMKDKTGDERDDHYDNVFNSKIILNHCKTPSYTDEELEDMKPALVGILVNTILRESGIGASTNKKKIEKNIEDVSEKK